MKISDNTFNKIAEFEGLRLTSYKCPAGILTIGYGHTGKDVKENQIIDNAQAKTFLWNDLEKC